MAASIIANPLFPRKRLIPKAAPPPFQNHGHMLLFDYGLMLAPLWQVIGEMKRAARMFTHRRWKIRLLCPLCSCIAGLVVAGATKDAVVGVTVGLLSLIISLLFAHVLWLHPLDETFTNIRATAVRQLLATGEPFQVDSEVSATIGKELSRVGDGELGQPQIPVLTVAEDTHPFPGYGQLRADNVFVCPPKEGGTAKHSVGDIRRNISDSIRQFCAKSEIRNITSGEVLVIYGRSLMIDHPILRVEQNGEKVPPLWLSKDEVNHLDGRPNAALRVFFAVQILFPQYETLTTFFTRPFLAGNSAGYQIAVSTLGPPVADMSNLRERLKQHELSQSTDPYIATEERTTRLGVVQSIRSNARFGVPFKTPSVDATVVEEIASMSPGDVQDGLTREVAELNKETVWWPGIEIKVRNWREDNSSDFTNSFFGKPEAFATVRTMYVQLSKVILNGLESLAYDISDYKTDEGRYTINADKIDQIVMGEQVHVTEKQKEQREQSTTVTTQRAKQGS